MSDSEWQKYQEEQASRRWADETTTSRIASKIIALLRDQWDFKKIDEMVKVTSDQLQALWESVRHIDERQEQLNSAKVKALKAKLNTYISQSQEHE